MSIFTNNKLCFFSIFLLLIACHSQNESNSSQKKSKNQDRVFLVDQLPDHLIFSINDQSTKDKVKEILKNHEFKFDSINNTFHRFNAVENFTININTRFQNRQLHQLIVRYNFKDVKNLKILWKKLTNELSLLADSSTRNSGIQQFTFFRSKSPHLRVIIHYNEDELFVRMKYITHL